MTIASYMKASGLALAAILAATSGAQALTIAEQRAYDNWVNELSSSSSEVAAAQKACGVNLPVKLDPALAAPFIAEQKHAGSFCDDAFYAFVVLCGDAAGKNAIAQKVRSVSCTLNASKNGLSTSLVNGELQVSFGVDTINIHDGVKKYLENNL